MGEYTIETFEDNGILNIEEIIKHYNNYLYTVVKNSISNEQDIEEILSDAYVIFWKKYVQLDKKTKVKHYLVGIIRNLIKKKYNDYNFINVDIDEYEYKASDELNIEELIVNKEKIKIIEETLESINNIDKDIFMMHYYEQMKVKDISDLMNISESKVKVTLHRIRKKIIKKLKKRGYDYGK